VFRLRGKIATLERASGHLQRRSHLQTAHRRLIQAVDDGPRLAVTETAVLLDVCRRHPAEIVERSQHASVRGRCQGQFLVLVQHTIDVDRREPLALQQLAQPGLKEGHVVPDAVAAEPHRQEGEERSLAGENDVLLAVDPQQIRIPVPQPGGVRRLR
jgi:hypothetical protein